MAGAIFIGAAPVNANSFIHELEVLHPRWHCVFEEFQLQTRIGIAFLQPSELLFEGFRIVCRAFAGANTVDRKWSYESKRIAVLALGSK
jgi:hypothetical protein